MASFKKLRPRRPAGLTWRRSRPTTLTQLQLLLKKAMQYYYVVVFVAAAVVVAATVVVAANGLHLKPYRIRVANGDADAVVKSWVS